MNHNSLALAFNSRGGKRRRLAYRVTDQGETRDAIAKQLNSATEPDAHYILSTERAARLTEDEAAELYTFLRQFFDEITVLVYLRRRDFMIASNFPLCQPLVRQDHESIPGILGAMERLFDVDGFRFTGWGFACRGWRFS